MPPKNTSALTKQVLLIANGDVSHSDKLRLKKHYDLIVAADGGASAALQIGYSPDVVIGDLDSITDELRENLSTAQFLFRPSQEINDLHKALDFCLLAGAQSIDLIGITGKRFDHSLNNFSVLCHFDQLMTLNIFDTHGQIYIVRDQIELTGFAGQTVSLIPIGEVSGIQTTGLKWQLNDETLAFGVREGCSNELLATTATITIQSGILLVFVND
jgi:thiamine pyrophosphokinase